MHGCVVCPAADNVPKGHKDDPDSWAIFPSYVHDGNFKAQHTVSRQPGNNVPIFPGTGAFQHPDSVKADLESMLTDKEIREKEPELVRFTVASFCFPVGYSHLFSLRRTYRVTSIKPPSLRAKHETRLPISRALEHGHVPGMEISAVGVHAIMTWANRKSHGM